MKAITLLASLVVTLSSCNCQKKAAEKSMAVSETTIKQETMPTLEYELNTRGFYRKVSITNQIMAVTSVRDGKPTTVKISDADWKELVILTQAVNKEGLETLKAPTEKRFYDGAPIANFRIITKDKTFDSAPFDGGFPPAEIEKIINKIVAIDQKLTSNDH